MVMMSWSSVILRWKRLGREEEYDEEYDEEYEYDGRREGTHHATIVLRPE